MYVGGSWANLKWIKFWCHERSTFDQGHFSQFGNLRPLAIPTNYSFSNTIYFLLICVQWFIDFDKLTSVSNENEMQHTWFNYFTPGHFHSFRPLNYHPTNESCHLHWDLLQFLMPQTLLSKVNTKKLNIQIKSLWKA